MKMNFNYESKLLCSVYLQKFAYSLCKLMFSFAHFSLLNASQCLLLAQKHFFESLVLSEIISDSAFGKFSSKTMF